MSYEIAASRLFPGEAREIYAVLADYRDGHRRMLPTRYFSMVQVLDGGVGEGTELRFHIKGPGQERPVWAVITEPEPGRVITETDLLSGAETRFEVEEEGECVRVTIRTRLVGRSGVLGRLERYLTRVFLRHVFEAELRLLDRAVRGSNATTRAGELEGEGDSPRRRWSATATPPELPADAVSRFVEAP